MLDVSQDRTKFEDVIAEAHRYLKASGFSYKRTIHSALYTRTYVNDETDQEVSIDGWHGTGKRGYGDGMTIFNVYATKKDRPSQFTDKMIGTLETIHEVCDCLDAFEFSGQRCLWTSAEQRDRAMENADKVLGIIKDWLAKTR